MKPGDRLPTLTVGDIEVESIAAIMEVMGDSNPIHLDAALAASLGLRGPVNQGPANLAYVTNMLMAWAGGPSAIRNLRFRFLDIVVPGDRLEATGQVTAVKDGLAECDFELRSPGRLHLAGSATLVIADA